MLKKSKIYVLVCDRCKIEYPNIHYFNKDAFSDVQNYIDYIEEVSSEDGWVKYQKEHYCFECYTIDEYDDIQIKLL